MAGPERERTVQGLLEATGRELMTALDAQACAISRIVGDLLISLVAVARGKGTLEIAHEYLISDYPLTLEVVTTGAPRAVSRLEAAPEPTEAELLEQFGFESLMMVCLRTANECWGLVEVYANGKQFGEEETRLAEQIVGHAGRRLDGLG